MNAIRKMAGLLASIMLIFILTSCATDGENGKGATDEKPIVFGEGDWDSNAFHDQVVKIIIEEGYGGQVDIVSADTAVMISGLKRKDIDVVLELWSDNVPTYQDDIKNGEYVELAVNFDDNMQGLYVPTYMVEGDNAIAPDLKTVEDLKKYAELFPDPEEPEKGIIYGGPEGWGATEFLHKKMKAYGLEEYFNFKTIDSSATLSATLASAYEKGQPWVGYNWEPTWIMGLYDLTLLEDTPYSAENYAKGVGAFASVDVMVVCANDFEERHPEIAGFLKNYTTSSSLTSAGLAYMQSNEVEADEAARWFLKENEDLWKSWVTEEAYGKIKKAIQ
ncbi:MAG: ABC transporter substrate-binding protein [Firmicutes bacterium]|nr:ABC transporter substrate-binding protein [Bacillota bacterium]